MKRELLKWVLAVALAGVVGVLAIVVIVNLVRLNITATDPGDQIAVTSRDSPLRVGPTTLVIELLDAFGEPLCLDVKVRSDALRIEGPAKYREPCFYDVPVTALREGPSTLVIEQWWNEHRYRTTTSVPIDVLPAE
ncbi:MAG: hypothetical protein ACKVWV_06680 [Planctomycetota bacterium]